MSIQARLSHVGGPLEGVARNSQQSWGERRGILITLRDEAGLEGFGEASPLPGYSPDTLETCWRALEDLPWDRAHDVISHAAPLEGLRSLSAFFPNDVPAARCGVETALADLMARRVGVPIWRWLSRGLAARESTLEATRLRAPRALSALLDARSETEAIALTEGLFEQGIHTVKLKVGTKLGRELCTLQALRRRFGAALNLRCDANQSLDLAAARGFLSELVELGLEFVEEPVKSSDLAYLVSPVPLGLDETLRADPSVASAALCHPAVRAVVLKPMVLGGFSACADWVKRAGPAQAIILSHLFDGPVALAAAAHAALVWGSTAVASGLGQHAGLGAWPAAHIGHVGESQIHATERPGLGLEWRSAP